MNKETPLWEAISGAITDVIPAEEGQTLVGDYVTVAEVMVEDGRIGVAVLTADMTQRHVVLLARAIAQIADGFDESGIASATEQGESDAA